MIYDVDELFCNKSIDQIKAHVTDVKSQISTTHNNLRALVGERYRDLLHSSDVILQMASLCDQISTISSVHHPTTTATRVTSNVSSTASNTNNTNRANSHPPFGVDWSRMTTFLSQVWDAIDKGLYLNAAVIVHHASQSVPQLRKYLRYPKISQTAKDNIEKWIRELHGLGETILSQCVLRVAQVGTLSMKREQHSYCAILLLTNDPVTALQKYLDMFRTHYGRVESKRTTLTGTDISTCVDIMVNAIRFIDGAFISHTLPVVPMGVGDDAEILVTKALQKTPQEHLSRATQELCGTFVTEATQRLCGMLAMATECLTTVASVRKLTSILEEHAIVHAQQGQREMDMWIEALHATSSKQICILLRKSAGVFAVDFQKALNISPSPGTPIKLTLSGSSSQFNASSNHQHHSTINSYRMTPATTAPSQEYTRRPTHIFDDALPPSALNVLHACVDPLHTVCAEISEAQTVTKAHPHPDLEAAIDKLIQQVCGVLKDATYPTDKALASYVIQGVQRAVLWYLTDMVSTTGPKQALQQVKEHLTNAYIASHNPWVDQCVAECLSMMKGSLDSTYFGPNRTMFKRLHSLHWSTVKVDGGDETSSPTLDIPSGPSEYVTDVLFHSAKAVCSSNPSLLRTSVVQALQEKLSKTMFELWITKVRQISASSFCEEAWLQLFFDVQYTLLVLSHANQSNSLALLRLMEDAVDPVTFSVALQPIKNNVVAAMKGSVLQYACHQPPAKPGAPSTSTTSSTAKISTSTLFFKECERFTLLPVTPNANAQHHGGKGFGSRDSSHLYDEGSTHGISNTPGHQSGGMAGGLLGKAAGSANMMKYLGWAT